MTPSPRNENTQKTRPKRGKLRPAIFLLGGDRNRLRGFLGREELIACAISCVRQNPEEMCEKKIGTPMNLLRRGCRKSDQTCTTPTNSTSKIAPRHSHSLSIFLKNTRNRLLSTRPRTDIVNYLLLANEVKQKRKQNRLFLHSVPCSRTKRTTVRSVPPTTVSPLRRESTCDAA